MSTKIVLPRTILFFLLIIFCSCTAKIDLNEEDTLVIRKSFEDLKAGMESISKVDPFALNKILDENNTLRQQLELYQKQLNSFGAIGGSVIINPQNRVFFKIVGYSGSFRIDAWVNDSSNKFIKNGYLLDTDKHLDLKFDLATKMIEVAGIDAWREATGKSMDGWLWDCRDGCQGHTQDKIFDAKSRFTSKVNNVRHSIDNEYETKVDAAFTQFLKSPFPLPSGSLSVPQAIDRRLQNSGGYHSIFVQLTPTELDRKQMWAIEFETYVLINNERSELIGFTRIDSSTDSSWVLNTPSNPVNVCTFFVKVTE
ncbi:MAG: hypothetical protein IPM56_11070 [Ignavibacteriales bacterium]|nr:MAG: hypothetical protein IPM56_11070 [Ignavibacteriales bacterium]